MSIPCLCDSAVGLPFDIMSRRLWKYCIETSHGSVYWNKWKYRTDIRYLKKPIPIPTSVFRIEKCRIPTNKYRKVGLVRCFIYWSLFHQSIVWTYEKRTNRRIKIKTSLNHQKRDREKNMKICISVAPWTELRDARKPEIEWHVMRLLYSRIWVDRNG